MKNSLETHDAQKNVTYGLMKINRQEWGQQQAIYTWVRGNSKLTVYED